LIFRYPDPAHARSGVSLLYIDVVGEGRDVTVDVRGEVDLATFELLGAAMQYALDKKPRRVSVRLSEVSFFGAVGLRALLTAQKQANEQGVELILTNPSSPVLIVLNLAGVTEWFKVGNGSSARMSLPVPREPRERQ
jgi:anti-anti-sigma factor